MHTLISVLVVILVFLVLAILWVYNQLILLHINKDNALSDMANDLDTLIEHLNTTTYKKVINKRNAATTPAEKIQAFNLLDEHIEDIASSELSVYLEQTKKQRMYYNHTTKKLNALLEVFPSNMVGHILGYEKEPLFILTQDEKRGETPGVKR